MSFWDHANIAINESDVVVEVLDARMPDLSRNTEVESKVAKKGKKLLFALNKADLISKETAEKIKRELGASVCVFVSGKTGKGVGKLREKLYAVGKPFLPERVKVCFVGYPNVGKSSLINALARRSRTMVSSVAGTTKGVQWVNLSGMKIIDSPGVIPFDVNDEVRLLLLGAKNPEKLKVPEVGAYKIIELFVGAKSKKLFELYEVPESDDLDEIFLSIGRAKKFLVKGGEVDEKRTAIKIIKDWQTGKLGL